MDLRDRKGREEFFCAWLCEALPQRGAISATAASYDETWSELVYATPAGTLAVRVEEGEETGAHCRTALVARLLAGGDIKKPLLAHIDFTTPIAAPGLLDVFAWDATRKLWPQPFVVRRWMEGHSLVAMPRRGSFHRAGAALRRFHATTPGFRTERVSPLQKELRRAENLLPAVLARDLKTLTEEGEPVTGLVHHGFFGGNVRICDTGAVYVPDWEAAGAGDLAEDFFPLKYWTVIDPRSGWYMPQESLFRAFCEGYGIEAYRALEARPLFRALEARWLVHQLGEAARRWETGCLREPYPEPDFYIGCLQRLAYA